MAERVQPEFDRDREQDTPEITHAFFPWLGRLVVRFRYAVVVLWVAVTFLWSEAETCRVMPRAWRTSG